MSGSKGFTLMEVLMVFAILGILAAISVPGYKAWAQNARFKEAAQLAYSVMRDARGQAIHINQPVPVVFTLGSNQTVQIAGGPAIIFASGIKIRRGENCDADGGTVTITFNPNGTIAENGPQYVCVYDGASRKYQIGVPTPNTGRIVTTKGGS